MSRKDIFSRGYSVSRERMEKNPYYSRSCFNCDYYYQAVGDKEECCQNSDVLQYDMVINNNNIYCIHWTQSGRNRKNSFFKKKKTGRDILD